MHIAERGNAMTGLLAGTEVVLLDIDGTLLDFDACVKYTMQSGFERYGLPRYEPWMFDVFTEINGGLWKQLERKEISQQELFAVRWARILDALGMDFDGATMEKYFRQNLMSSGIPVEGAGELLSALGSRFELGVASNGPYEQQVNRLSVAGFVDCFTYFFVSQRIGYSKPDARFFDTALAGINQGRTERGKAPVQPDQVLMVGDSLTSDMDGGISYGLRTCYYDPAYGGTQGRQVDLVIHSLKELCDLAADEAER